MAASTQSVLEGIERRRAQLQANVDELHKALVHWSTWEAEYEALKDEIQSAGDPSAVQISELARHLDGSLVNEKEVQDLLAKNAHVNRSANQVVDILSRRIDYVQQNSSTIEKQLDAAEKQLAGVDVLLEPGMDNEEGLPMMDIEEELDQQGNEISSSVNQTGKSAAEIVDALRRAGIQKAELHKMGQVQAPQHSQPAPTRAAPAEQDLDPSPVQAPVMSQSEQNNSTTSDPVLSRKTVSFVADVEDAIPSEKRSTLETDGYNEDLAATNFSSGTKVIELDENDSMVASYPVIPQGESPEDAELRRQMLQYGLSEVGQVVAELDLDQPTASYSDDDDDGYDDLLSDEEEEEDEYGRSLGSLVPEEYRKQMVELENKLGARMLENVGPQHGDSTLAPHVGGVGTMRVQDDDRFDQSLETSDKLPPRAHSAAQPEKKGVRFADSVDISPDPYPAQSMPPSAQSTPTVSDTVVERSAPVTGSSAILPKPPRVSRFKSARAQPMEPSATLPTPPVSEVAPTPTGPVGRTLAGTIIEHAPASSNPQPPSEFDPIVLNREIQVEYDKARNKFLQQQGKFQAGDDGPGSVVFEDDDGQTKKVSRFMAARLRPDGM